MHHVEHAIMPCLSFLIWIRFDGILPYVAFCAIMAISQQKEAQNREDALLLFRMTSRTLYSAQYHRQHCTLHAFEQFIEHCICTTTMTNIRSERESNRVDPGCKPQSIRKSLLGRPSHISRPYMHKLHRGRPPS